MKTGTTVNWTWGTSLIDKLERQPCHKVNSSGGNLLSDENYSFEGGTVGDWTTLTNCTTASDATAAYHGARSQKMTVTANGYAQSRLTATGITGAGTQYTLSAKFKGVVGRKYRVLAFDPVSGITEGSLVTADGTWQTATVTKTFHADSTARYIYCRAHTDALADDIVCWDSIILKAGASAIPPITTYKDHIIPAPASAPTLASNATLAFYLDQTNHKLKCVVKYSDGTSKTATLAFD